MPRLKKTPKTGGRQKGSVNKITKDLRESIQLAADAAHSGGIVGYLTQQAKENPNSFMALLGRTVPKEVIGNVDGSITINIVTGVPDAATDS